MTEFIMVAQMKQSVNGFYDRELVRVIRQNEATVWIEGYGRTTLPKKTASTYVDLNPVITRAHRGQDYMHRLMGLFSTFNPMIYHEVTEGILVVVLQRTPQHGQHWFTVIEMNTEENGRRDIAFNDFESLDEALGVVECVATVPF